MLDPAGFALRIVPDGDEAVVAPGVQLAIDFVIPDYKNFSHLDLPRYQINCRHRLLDNVTGYRNQLIQESFQFDLL